MKKEWMDAGARKLIGDLKSVFFAQWSGYNAFEVFDCEFEEAVIAYLKKRRRKCPAKDVANKLYFFKNSHSEGHDFFLKNVLPKVLAFARTDAEADALIMVLLEEVLALTSRHIYEEMEKRGLMSSTLDILG